MPHLRVRVSEKATSGGGARRRNALKVALPWELGHPAAFLLADRKRVGQTVLIGMASAALACALATGYLASLFIGTGPTPYDHAAGSCVVRSPAVETSGATR